MADSEFKAKQTPAERAATPGDPAYPAAVETMSDKWRAIQDGEQARTPRKFSERNFLSVGIGIGLLIVALLIVLGGLAFLVWNAR